MQLLILCGGFGTRLKPLTDTVPKPMLMFEEKPFLEYLINYYSNQGIKDIILSVGHLKDMIKDYFGDGKSMGVKIQYVEEQTPLGTGGAIKLAEDLLNDEFFVANGDTLIEIDLDEMQSEHNKQGLFCTVGVKKTHRKQNSGYIIFDENGVIMDFQSKENQHEDGYINSGIYLMNKKILKHFPSGKCSLENEIFPQLTEKMSVYKIAQGYFIDIGTFHTYNQFTREFKRIKNLVDDPLKIPS